MTEYRSDGSERDGPEKERPEIRTTIIERRGGGSFLILAIVALALILAIGYFLIAQQHSRNAQTDAVVGAAQSVGDAATRVGDAAGKAAQKLDEQH